MYVYLAMEESDGQEKGDASLQYPTLATPTHTDEELMKEHRDRESRPAYRKMMVCCHSDDGNHGNLLLCRNSAKPYLPGV